jgi:hypothetical protein
MKSSEYMRRLADNSGIKVDINLLSKILFREAEKKIKETAKRGDYEILLNFRGVYLKAELPKYVTKKKSYIPLIDQYDKLAKNRVKFSKWANSLIREFNRDGYIVETLLYGEGPVPFSRDDESPVDFVIPARTSFSGFRVRWDLLLNPSSDLSRKSDREIEEMMRNPMLTSNPFIKSSRPFNGPSF